MADAPPSLDQLNDGLKGLKDNPVGDPDVKLTTETLAKYVKAVDDFHDALKAARDKMNGLEELDTPGALRSAIQTATNLRLDVVGPDGVTQAVDKYLTYLHDLSKTVHDVGTKLIQSG